MADKKKKRAAALAAVNAYLQEEEAAAALLATCYNPTAVGHGRTSGYYDHAQAHSNESVLMFCTRISSLTITYHRRNEQ